MNLQTVHSDLYLSSMLNASHDGLYIYWFDLQNRLLKCNLTLALSLGFQDPQLLYGKTLMEIAKIRYQNTDQIDEILKTNNDIMHHLKAVIIEEQLDTAEGENYFLSYKAPFCNAQGQALGIMGISTDISKRKRLEKELIAIKMASDRYLESILLSSPNNIYWVDRTSRVIGCNDQQALYCGLKNRADLMGKSTEEIGAILNWPETMTQKIHDNDLRVMENRQTITQEERVNLNGNDLVFLSSKFPMYDEENNVIGMMGISTDITQQKLVENQLKEAQLQAEASNRAKTKFISNISHDIRTPLVGIQGLASMLKENIPKKYQNEAQAIVDASEELLILLNNVINLSKLEEDSKELKAEVFDLKNLVDKVIVLFTPVATQKGLNIQMEYDASLPQKYVSDPLLIQRIILNLVSNALKFTEKGHVIVKILPGLAKSDDNIIPIQIRVEDTGIGIPTHEQKEIFESFYRASNQTPGKYRGSGLGLSIVSRFLNQLQGKIHLESEAGQGSQFIISLNLLKANSQQIDSSTHWDDYAKDHVQTLNLSTKSKRKPRVLLVEDNPVIQKIVENLLEKLSCKVEIAHSGWQALKLVQKKKFDIIFMDIGLPDQDGFAIAKRIRHFSSPKAETPIIALTAQADIDFQQACFESGINEMILKPISLENAKKCIEKYFCG